MNYPYGVCCRAFLDLESLSTNAEPSAREMSSSLIPFSLVEVRAAAFAA